jgi:hypothetical protein
MRLCPRPRIRMAVSSPDAILWLRLDTGVRSDHRNIILVRGLGAESTDEAGTGSWSGGDREDRGPGAPGLLDRVRLASRTSHYRLRTEDTYVGRMGRFFPPRQAPPPGLSSSSLGGLTKGV